MIAFNYSSLIITFSLQFQLGDMRPPFFYNRLIIQLYFDSLATPTPGFRPSPARTVPGFRCGENAQSHTLHGLFHCLCVCTRRDALRHLPRGERFASRPHAGLSAAPPAIRRRVLSPVRRVDSRLVNARSCLISALRLCRNDRKSSRTNLSSEMSINLDCCPFCGCLDSEHIHHGRVAAVIGHEEERRHQVLLAFPVESPITLLVYSWRQVDFAEDASGAAELRPVNARPTPQRHDEVGRSIRRGIERSHLPSG